MPSASSGRYQSRLFNFIHRHSRRLQQQCKHAFQNLRTSVNWVAAVGLYPLLLFQSTRSTSKQLDRAVQQTLLQLPTAENGAQPQTPPTVDTPVQQVLLLVEALSSEEVSRPLPPKPEPLKNFLAFLAPWRFKVGVRSQESGAGGQRLLTTHYSLLTTHYSLSTSPPSIQGIATHLSSQTLVLVTAQNEILDILTSQQQQKLQERITALVADYWRYQRLAHSGRWAGEAGGKTLLTTHYSLLTTLDRTVAAAEANLMPVSEVAIALYQNSWQLVQRLQTQWSTSLSKNRAPGINLDDSKSRANRILDLIWAAVDYFFGGGEQHLIQTVPKSSLNPSRLTQNLAEKQNLSSNPALAIGALQEKQLPQRHTAKLSSSQARSTHLPFCRSSANQNIEDPWLDESDLFGEPAVNSQIAKQQTKPRLIKSFQKHKTSGAPQVYRQSNQVEAIPDWIEAHATVMGYVKHPLEQLLAWLDQIMLWLEEILLKVWQWIRKKIFTTVV